ncbi:MAG: aspartate dehydrogenase [Woeseiaceae bacterium]
MKIGIIGDGAIAHYVRDKATDYSHTVVALLLRAERTESNETEGISCVSDVAALPDSLDHMVDCAGHSALRSYGPDILRRGINLTTVSIGALADSRLSEELEAAANEGNTQLFLASGAIGALDCLRAARVGELDNVTYIGRKPPIGWRGSPAESSLDLMNLTTGEHVHFEGSARDAAMQYPKNANVAAAVALSGIGFDATEVRLIADADVSENVHQVQASGEFGSFSFEIRGNSLQENPRSSALAAMSVLSSLEQTTQHIVY